MAEQLTPLEEITPKSETKVEKEEETFEKQIQDINNLSKQSMGGGMGKFDPEKYKYENIKEINADFNQELEKINQRFEEKIDKFNERKNLWKIIKEELAKSYDNPEAYLSTLIKAKLFLPEKMANIKISEEKLEEKLTHEKDWRNAFKINAVIKTFFPGVKKEIDQRGSLKKAEEQLTLYLKEDNWEEMINLITEMIINFPKEMKEKNNLISIAKFAFNKYKNQPKEKINQNQELLLEKTMREIIVKKPNVRRIITN